MSTWIKKVAPKPVGEVLRALVEVSLQGGDNVPTLSLHMADGSAVSGRIVAADLQKARTLVVQDPAGSGRRLHYVAQDRVVGLTVDDGEALAATLSFGAIDPATLGEPPRPLALNRELATMAANLSAVFNRTLSLGIDWTGFDKEDAAALASLGATVAALNEVLHNLSQDEFARSVVAGKIAQISVVAGAKADLQLSDGHLKMAIHPATGLAGRFTNQALAEALNKLL